MAKKQYRVTTVLGFEAAVRRRAGIEVGARREGGFYEGPLTAGQLDEILDDTYLQVRELDGSGHPGDLMTKEQAAVEATEPEPVADAAPQQDEPQPPAEATEPPAKA